MNLQLRGTLPAIIRNDNGLYEGDLKDYFRVVFHNAQNLQRGYHNFRHMFHVTWLCYQAIIFYGERLSKRDARNLLIAAMFHDFDHPGTLGHDDLNVERAIRGLRKWITHHDMDYMEYLASLIRSTEYPHVSPTRKLDLCGQILRDADMGQSFAQAWLQQVVFGFAKEWSRNPLEILKSQPAFLRSVEFHTEWGQQMFPRMEIDAKILEVEELLELVV